MKQRSCLIVFVWRMILLIPSIIPSFVQQSTRRTSTYATADGFCFCWVVSAFSPNPFSHHRRWKQRESSSTSSQQPFLTSRWFHHCGKSNDDNSKNNHSISSDQINASISSSSSFASTQEQDSPLYQRQWQQRPYSCNKDQKMVPPPFETTTKTCFIVPTELGSNHTAVATATTSFTTTAGTKTKEDEEELVEATIRQQLHPFQLETKRTLFVLSVSGGCDSIALLHAMMRWIQSNPQLQSQCRVHVVHFHHHQRPITADLDCALVQELCQSYYQIPFHVYHWTDRTTHTNDRTFSQDTARRWRRDMLQQYMATQIKSTQNNNNNDNNIHPLLPFEQGFIVTAHHKDDSYESLLLKMIRGVYLTNLSGMTPITPIHHLQSTTTTITTRDDVDENYNNNNNDNKNHHQVGLLNNLYWFRPLLTLSKQELTDYLQRHNYTWREDESNESSKYLRNRIRRELIPLLQDLMLGGGSPSSSCSTHDTLSKRLDHVMEQSQDIARQLKPMIDDYLQHAQIFIRHHHHHRHYDLEEETKVAFQLNKEDWRINNNKTNNNNNGQASSTWIPSQALYQWLCSEIQRQQQSTQNNSNSNSNSNHNNNYQSHDVDVTSISYDTLQRIKKQIQDHWDQDRWMLDIGNHWMVQRQGNVLLVDNQTNPKSSTKSFPGLDLTWTILAPSWSHEERTVPEGNKSLRLAIPVPTTIEPRPDTASWKFVLTTVGQANHIFRNEKNLALSSSLTFVPSWRKGRSPTKIRQFLRGQGMTEIHEREQVPIVLFVAPAPTTCSDNKHLTNHDYASTVRHVVAIQVRNDQEDCAQNSKWLIHADFDVSTRMTHMDRTRDEPHIFVEVTLP